MFRWLLFGGIFLDRKRPPCNWPPHCILAPWLVSRVEPGSDIRSHHTIGDTVELAHLLPADDSKGTEQNFNRDDQLRVHLNNEDL
jgi:hypothetical protein